MKKNRHLNTSEKGKEVCQVNPKSYPQGITKRLLDKYKPSVKFTLLDGKANVKNEIKAA
tara:strand:- start:84 stop:260 length:177 start_codon:yes stop_codon:yes gene_type:complete